jgi:hypothetical protein
MAPDLSDLDLLEKPKKDGKKLPFLWLTARDTVEDDRGSRSAIFIPVRTAFVSPRA